MPPEEERRNASAKRSLIGVSLLHFINDLHPTFLPTFLPAITERLALNFAEAGFLNTLFGVLNLFWQPLAGHIADGLKKPHLALWCPLVTAAGACLLPVAPNYAIAMLCVALLGLGTASFHPQAHGVTGIAGGDKNLSLYLSIFAASGTIGAALSPLYAVALVKTVGVRFVPLSLILVAAVIVYARFTISPDICRSEDAEAHEAAHRKSHFFANLKIVLGTCGGLMLIAIVRDSTSQGIRVFLPLLITTRGGSISSGGTILFLFTLAGVVANITVGRIADRVGKMRLCVALLALAPIALFPAIHASGPLSIALFIVGGALIAASNPITLAMAQEKNPTARSVASSLVMGVAWGIANIVASPIGMLADRVGLTAALSVVSFAPWLLVAGYLISRMTTRNSK